MYIFKENVWHRSFFYLSLLFFSMPLSYSFASDSGGLKSFEHAIEDWSKNYAKAQKRKIIDLDIYGKNPQIQKKISNKGISYKKIEGQSDEPVIGEPNDSEPKDAYKTKSWAYNKNDPKATYNFKFHHEETTSYGVSVTEAFILGLNVGATIKCPFASLGTDIKAEVSTQEARSRQFSRKITFYQEDSGQIPPNSSLKGAFAVRKTKQKKPFTFKNHVTGDFIIYSKNENIISGLWDRRIEVLDVSDVFRKGTYKEFSVDNKKVSFESKGEIISYDYTSSLLKTTYQYNQKISEMSEQEQKKLLKSEAVEENGSQPKKGEEEEIGKDEQSSYMPKFPELMYDPNKTYAPEDSIEGGDSKEEITVIRVDLTKDER